MATIRRIETSRCCIPHVTWPSCPSAPYSGARIRHLARDGGPLRYHQNTDHGPLDPEIRLIHVPMSIPETSQPIIPAPIPAHYPATNIKSLFMLLSRPAPLPRQYQHRPSYTDPGPASVRAPSPGIKKQHPVATTSSPLLDPSEGLPLDEQILAGYAPRAVQAGLRRVWYCFGRRLRSSTTSCILEPRGCSQPKRALHC